MNCHRKRSWSLKSLQTLVKMRIRKLIEKETPYKEIYQDVKMLVDEF